jgi:hypothetical protein
MIEENLFMVGLPTKGEALGGVARKEKCGGITNNMNETLSLNSW